MRYRLWIVGRNNARHYRQGNEKNSAWLRSVSRSMITIDCENVAADGVVVARSRGAIDGDLLVFANEFMVVANRLVSARPHVVRLAEGQDGSIVSEERQATINEARRRADELTEDET